MEIIQFDDKNLAHYSYAIISGGEMALIDPSRDPQQYYDLAKQQQAKIVAVIETHPHADFVSSHLEIHQTTGAAIYVSKLLDANYDHHTFDEGEEIIIGTITLKALNTPGHSPDSICVIAMNEQGKPKAVFTGDTLFIGDCGRPDLRESAGAITATREDLAKQMYYSLRNKLMMLPDDVLVYPAHGAGSLCGKDMSDKNTNTIGNEKAVNWSLQTYTEAGFMAELLANQPFVPKYFPYDVELNKNGVRGFNESIAQIKIVDSIPEHLDDYVIIDTRDEALFKKGHLKNSINLMDDLKFETWLGSIVAPHEKFYLIGEGKNQLQTLIERVAKIGYENQIISAFVANEIHGEKINGLDVDQFKKSINNYTILDVRNPSEVKENTYFDNSINIPLYELRERAGEIPAGKPIVVHCAGGYRSAAAASIVKAYLNGASEVFDLGKAIKAF